MSEKYIELKSKLRRLQCQVCELQQDGNVETDPIFSASPAFGITTPNINSWNSVASGSYITTNTSQTGLTGDKTTSGLWTFTAPWNPGQATFGSIGQGGRIRFFEGSTGTEALSMGFGNSTNSSAVILAYGSLTLRSTVTNGINLESINGTGIINFITGNTQSMRLFSNGNLRIGASTTDSGEKLQIQGTSLHSGVASFTDTWTNGQATFGSIGQGGKISLIEGTSGTSAFTISYFNSTSLGAIIQGNSSSGLVVRNTGSTGYVGLEATGASGFLNFISGNAQAARLFANGNLRIGASAVDSGNKLQVDGNSGFVGNITVAGNIVPDVTNTRLIGSASLLYNNIYSTIFTGSVFRAPNSGGLFLSQSGGTSGLQINNSARILIQNGGTFTDSGEQFQVVGSSKLAGNVGVTGTIISTLDQEVTTIGSGYILKSPDGTRYKVSVANGGALSAVPA